MANVRLPSAFPVITLLQADISMQPITSLPGLTPLLAFNGDTITMTGTNFRPETVVYLGAYPVSQVSVTENEIKFIIPEYLGLTSWSISARYPYQVSGYWTESVYTFSEPLRLTDFTITNITPMSAESGDLLTITGTNFNNPVVIFGMTTAEVVESTREQITVRVPPLSSGYHTIFVTVGERTHDYLTPYDHIGPWLRHPDLTFPYEYGCVFDFGEEVYIATGGVTGPYVMQLYRFNPGTRWFNKLPGTWQTSIRNPVSCTLNGKGYIIGFKATFDPVGFEVFNPDSLKWRELPDYPGTKHANLCLVADDSVIYAGCGKNMDFNIYEWYKDFWKYSPATGRWTRLADSPMSISFTNHVFIDGRLLFLGFQGVSGARYLLEYLPQTDTWIQEEITEEDLGYWGLSDIKNGARVSLVSGGKWYLGFGDWYQSFEPGAYSNTSPDVNNRFYSFDPANNTWTTLSNVAAPPRTFALSFTSDGKIFIAGSQVLRYNDFWEYDPQLDQ